MVIYRMIRNSVFEPEAIERMTAAYEHALKKFLNLPIAMTQSPNWLRAKSSRSQR